MAGMANTLGHRPVRNRTIMYKSASGCAAKYLPELFVKNSAVSTTKPRNTEDDFRAPHFKTLNGQKSISFRGPKLWNQFSSGVKLALSSLTLKRRLKKKLCKVIVSLL